MKKKIAGDSVHWGILGVGDVCEVKSAPAMQLIDDSSLVAVMRRNGEKAADYARRHSVPKWYDDADQLINDPDINAVYIATPPNAHAELTRKVAEAGKPVYVEKPMARTDEECEMMIQACEQHGVPLYVAYYRRCLPNFLKIKALVDGGVIGDVRAVQISLLKTAELYQPVEDQNWRVDPSIAGAGYFFDLASHQLDFLDYLLGPVAETRGFARNQASAYEAEDIVSGSFAFESGVLGMGMWCFTTAQVATEEMTTLIGSKGTIKYQNFGDNKVILETDKGGREVFEFEMPKHIQQPLIQTVVDDLLGRGICPSTGVSAARTNEVMSKMVF